MPTGDREAKNVAIRYSERLAEAGIAPSVGSKGDSYDNALADTINGLYKARLIHRGGPWKSPNSVKLVMLKLGILVQSSAVDGAPQSYSSGES